MKTVLRVIAVLAFLCFSEKNLYSQCTASDIQIQHIVPVGVQTPGSCTATFDLSFTMQTNNGNKFIFFHAWRPDLYPDYFNCINGQPGGQGAIQAPGASVLANAFINIGINNSGAVPVLLTNYPPNGAVTLNSAMSVTSTILPNGSTSFIIHGVTATLPGDCNGPILFTADFWSSQSANAQVAQCVSCHKNFALNFLQASGIALCVNLTYAITLTNRTGAALSGTYQVYADVNNDGVLSTTTDALIRNTTNFSIAAGVGMTTPVTGTIPGNNMNQNLLILVNLESPANGNSIYTILSTQCAVLPVTFQSFTAVRSSADRVRLKWETATEVNNTGFAVERNTGGSWETVTFVPTQATTGTSSSLLTYIYEDMNTFKGVSQYRIRHVDLDGNARLSEIRLVRGDLKSSSMVIYPNPANGGTITVLFNDDKSTKDIILFDLNGRVIRKWNANIQNPLKIDNLGTGVYTLKTVVRETGMVITEKIVVY